MISGAVQDIVDTIRTAATKHVPADKLLAFEIQRLRGELDRATHKLENRLCKRCGNAALGPQLEKLARRLGALRKRTKNIQRRYDEALGTGSRFAPTELDINVRLEPDGKTFVATSNWPRAHGVGGTVGRAVLNMIDNDIRKRESPSCQ